MVDVHQRRPRSPYLQPLNTTYKSAVVPVRIGYQCQIKLLGALKYTMIFFQNGLKLIFMTFHFFSREDLILPFNAFIAIFTV